MSDQDSSPGVSGTGRGLFPVTHWTEIARINNPEHPEAHEALENLCRTYLPAIETYLRCIRNLPGEPHEIANDFLAKFISDNSLQRVDRNKGKFRSFLLGALRHYLLGEWRRKRNLPVTVELDDELLHATSDIEAVERFDRKVAELLVKTAITQVKQRFIGTRIEPQIPFFLPYLTVDPPKETLRDLAQRLGISEDLAYQNFKRVRDSLHEQLRRETRKLLGPDDSVEEELQALLRIYAKA